jgi:hypothetical protein
MFGIFENFECGQAKHQDIKTHSKPGNRNTCDFGISTGKHIGTAAGDMTGNRAGISLDGQVERIDHSGKRQNSDYSGSGFHFGRCASMT